MDCIATDHAPHASHEKEVEFERAPNGITGLETALGLALRILHREKEDAGGSGAGADEWVLRLGCLGSRIVGSLTVGSFARSGFL